MNQKEAKKLIENYRPHKGFFDLSVKPQSLSKIEYAKILKLQNFLAEQNKQADYLRKFNKVQWDKIKELSADLQKMIFQYWGLENVV